MKSTTPVRKPASREGIIEEAIAIAEESGWSAVTVRAIANKMHYRPPVLYQFFKNKEALIQEIAGSGFDRLSGKMMNAASKQSTLEAKLLALAVARFQFSLEEPTLHHLMFSTGCPVWQKKMIFSSMHRTRNLIVKLVQELSQRDDECIDLITHFIALIKGYTFFATELNTDVARHHFFGNLSAQEAFSQSMQHFINSIKST
jgi:AcrR family transcriptional regulator